MYEGDLLDEEKHGTGEYRYADGTVYSGEWHRGLRQGFGTLISPSGALYEGGLLPVHERVRAQNNGTALCTFVCFGWKRGGQGGPGGSAVGR